jgi:hypothetical protein
LYVTVAPKNTRVAAEAGAGGGIDDLGGVDAFREKANA